MDEKKFHEPTIGECHYTSFYLSNDIYGGYSAVCERGRIDVDYKNASKVVDLAEKANMDVRLAGGEWRMIGKVGWGELVPPTEARKLIKVLKEAKSVV